MSAVVCVLFRESVVVDSGEVFPLLVRGGWLRALVAVYGVGFGGALGRVGEVTY